MSISRLRTAVISHPLQLQPCLAGGRRFADPPAQGIEILIGNVVA
jgi:hypothetical protein